MHFGRMQPGVLVVASSALGRGAQFPGAPGSAGTSTARSVSTPRARCRAFTVTRRLGDAEVAKTEAAIEARPPAAGPDATPDIKVPEITADAEQAERP